jgi:hypothetical protein
MMPVHVLNGIKAKSVAGLAMPTPPWRPLGAPRLAALVGGGLLRFWLTLSQPIAGGGTR